MDIRRYFGGGSPQTSKATEQKASKKNGGSKKKKKAVIESDSDDDIFIPKKKQATKESPVKKSKKTPVKSPAKPEKKEVNIALMFGAAPVKRTAPKIVTKPPTAPVELTHDDEDFENVLRDLDDNLWTNGGISVEDSSSKKDSTPKDSTLEKDSTSRKDSSVEESPIEVRQHSSPSKETSPMKSIKDESSTKATPRKTNKSPVKIVSPSKKVKHEPPKERSAEKKPKVFENEKNSVKSASTSSSKTERNEEICKEKRKESVREENMDTSENRTTNNKPLHFGNLKRKAESNEISPKDTKLPKTENVEKARECTSKVMESVSTSVVNESSSKSSAPLTSSAPLVPLTPQQRSELWVDKHKPTSLKQIIGQQGEKGIVQKLLKWLSSWHQYHGPGATKKAVRPGLWSKDHNGEFFKAALLSGPPGVGKTTTAHLVCKELGMDVVEFNASDTRSKKLLNAEVTELLSNMTLQPFFKGGGTSKTSDKHVLVMDEVDGMAGNEDRGGVQELINLIKNSKCPVICMCNDRQHPKVRSLANYCFDLRFHKPKLEQIRGRMMSVCFNEKIKIKADALDEIIIGANNDIRQILHNLSMWCSSSKTLSADQARVDANSAKKDIKVGPWDALRSVFSSNDRKNMTFNDKADLFFTDYNIMPLFVQENYLRVTPHNTKNIHETLDRVAKAALSISTGDLIEKEIRSRNDAWSLLPVQAVFSCVAPGDYMEGHLNGQIQFPAWLGKNSNRSKLDRFLQELQTHMRLSISGGKQALNLEYLHHLHNKLITPLLSEGSAGVPAVLQIMRDYYLTRDDLDSIFELNQWPGLPDPMSRIESKVKAALTRAYNKEGVVTPYAIHAPVKKKGGAASPEDGYEDEDAEDIEDDEDDDAADAMIKAKPKAAEKATKAAASAVAGMSKRGSRGGGARGRGRGRGK